MVANMEINWVSVNERLPDSKRLVFVAMSMTTDPHDGWIVHIGYFYASMGWELPYWEGLIEVVYWMDCPPLPRIDKKL